MLFLLVHIDALCVPSILPLLHCRRLHECPPQGAYTFAEKEQRPCQTCPATQVGSWLQHFLFCEQVHWLKMHTVHCLFVSIRFCRSSFFLVRVARWLSNPCLPTKSAAMSAEGMEVLGQQLFQVDWALTHVGFPKQSTRTSRLPASSSCSFRSMFKTVPDIFCAFLCSCCTGLVPDRTERSCCLSESFVRASIGSPSLTY